MPDLLLIEPDNGIRFKIESLAEKAGFRTKSAVDMKTALEWLELKEFDCVIAYIGFDYPRQQRAAELLWKRNQLAPYVVIDPALSATKVDRGEYRLLGVEVFEGPSSYESIEKLLGQLRVDFSFTNEGFRILVVEDLDSPRDIICSYIERLGFPNVEGASSVPDALARLQDHPGKFSCVITDISMPKVTGMHLITTVRASSSLKHLPVIVLTAYGTADCLIDCLKAGASGFLVKPPSRKDLQREIGRAVRISAKKSSPRMADEADAEKIRAALMQKGFC